MTAVEAHMRAALAAAQHTPYYPFGAVLVDRQTGRIVGRGWNRADQCPTLHGEMDVIERVAAASAGIDWAALDLYTTAEPCPMCMGAILWAGIGKVYYGSSIPTLKATGLDQIDLRAHEVVARAGFATTEVQGGVLQAACDARFVDASRLRAADAEK